MMSQQVETRHSRIAATYKAREVEGALDLYFYRPLGFRLAEFFAHLKLTPAGVSLLAGLSGVIAGHLYFTRIPPSISPAWCFMSVRMRWIMQTVSLRG